MHLSARRGSVDANVAADETPLPPSPGSPVTFVLDDVRMRAKVETAAGDALVLVLPSAPGALRRPGGTDVRVEFVGERGPCRLLGTATVALSDAAREQRVRFAQHGAPQLLLRSERVRAPVHMEIKVDVGNQVVTRRTHDLRASGALVPGPLELEVDAELRFGLRIPGRPTPLEGTARVARVTDEGDVALQFLELSAADSADLMLAVFEAQRAKAA